MKNYMVMMAFSVVIASCVNEKKNDQRDESIL